MDRRMWGSVPARGKKYRSANVLIPKTLALMAAQRQTAASRLASPSMRVQHGALGWVPMTTSVRRLRKLTHTPNLSTFIGHVSFGWGEGVGIFGVRGHGGGGGGGQPFGVWVEATKVNKIKLKVRRKDVVAKALEAIIYSMGFLYRCVEDSHDGSLHLHRDVQTCAQSPPETLPLETQVTQPQPIMRSTTATRQTNMLSSTA
ncbi:hypothetical protein E3N88_30416 [Mikania micrantha]|uniref:Uncharacterized protein n=1 Tax=Mikania micrantha TaxID=192012 RepID=A0A5N6MMB2_9ASTR|nr:hypothetical protein E3N88_30416 [Mikania micrantha]